jgi:GAF domain-containing protein
LLPQNEAGRLAAVRRYDVLDTPPDGSFDRITALAARLFSVPISIVSIVDTDRIWFRSHYGLENDEIGRDAGLCASAICQLEPWLVTDASVDPRTIDNPLVAGELGLRFYLGVPLTTSDGFNLGTLNVIDVEPREVSEDEVRTLQDLAAIVVDELELRLAARRTLDDRRRRAVEMNDDIVQGLALARLALETGREEMARDALAGTLTAARAIMTSLLEESEATGPLRPGDLVRDAPAALSG